MKKQNHNMSASQTLSDFPTLSAALSPKPKLQTNIFKKSFSQQGKTLLLKQE